MFDGRFDRYFHEAFLSREKDKGDLPLPAWLAALACVGALWVLGAIPSVTRR